jgi:hypothetical protein
MNRSEVPIHTPCGADWSGMTTVEARARLCADCNKVVHDVSAMKAYEVRGLLADGPVCVRYLYDVHGRVLLGGAPAGARIVPASALLSRVARSKWLAAAAVAASAIVFEACGGNDGRGGTSGVLDQPDAAPTNPRATEQPAEHVPSQPTVGDGGEPDAGDPDASAPDAAP